MEQCRDVELREDSGNTVHGLLRVSQLTNVYPKDNSCNALCILAKIFPQQYLIVFLFPSNIKLVEIRNGARSKTLN